MRGTPRSSGVGEITFDRAGYERLVAALARTPATCQETAMQDDIKVKRAVRKGRPCWNISRGGVFHCRVFSEKAVRDTLTRLRVIAAKAVA